MSAAPSSSARVPSIRQRLSRALLSWSLVWGAFVLAAIALTVPEEVHELLDDTQVASAEVLAGAWAATNAASLTDTPTVVASSGRFSWQVVGAEGALIRRSEVAPDQAWHRAPLPGFSNVGAWRVYGVALGPEGHMLYVAQTLTERREASLETGMSAAGTAALLGLMGWVWLRQRVQQELKPLARLAEKLTHLDPARPGQGLGPAERAELVPVHEAVTALGRRLADRLASERAFSAHAAHALRTPLAGMDAQLAVAMREAMPSVQQRLQKTRLAVVRMQGVLASLLVLFRGEAQPQRQRIHLPEWVAQVPVSGVTVTTTDGWVEADPALLSAALMNLLDNAQRHGAQHVHISLPREQVIRVQDDGPGVTPERRHQIQQTLADAEGGGLGLRLVSLILQAHGGTLGWPEVQDGWAVELVLGPDTTPSAGVTPA
ncbi:MAG: sensor histidine kinase [Aquabacterium sp.]